MIEHPDEGKLPPISGPSSEESPDGAPTPRVEGYEIIGPLGRGGMGTVWRAVQLSTRRQVALKLLETGAFGSQKALARFEREIELTARLQHPNIAQIFESGQYNGTHYYAMELIEGVPLDQYVKEHCLPQRQALELMGTVCKAVQHAHERGVIHRDLKPSNILMTLDGQPHVLDFGLAKAFQVKDWGLNVSTNGEPVGTPAYMSPEQAAGSVDLIDTRTDVYALGTILFQVLTGQSPHDLSGTRYEVLRRISEEEVERPREVAKNVDRELEALLLKALAHDPKERYASAGALAQDIENYLDGEPLTAQRPTAAYFLWKRIRKYRTPVAIGSSFLAVLIGMAVLSYVRIAHERDKAIAAGDDARKEADRAEATYESLHSMLLRIYPPDVLGEENILLESSEGEGRERSRDYSYDDLRMKLGDQPEEEAAVRTASGAVHLALGDVKAAEVQFSRALEIRRRALGGEHPATLRSMVNLAVTLGRGSQLDEAEHLLKYAVEIQRRVLGEKHPETLRAMNNLGIVLHRRGKLDEAEKVLGRCLDVEREVLAENHRDTFNTIVSLASTVAGNGRLEQADELLRECLRAKSRVPGGPFRLDTYSTVMKLAILLRRKGDFAAAVSRLQECISGQTIFLGPRHPTTVTSKMNLALTLLERGNYDEGIEVFKECLETDHGFPERQTPYYLDLRTMGFMDSEPDKAKAYYEEVATHWQRVLGKEHPYTLRIMMMRGIALLKNGEPEQAEETWRQCLEVQRRVLGDKHPDTLSSMMNLAVRLERTGRKSEAEAMYGRVEETCQRVFMEQNPDTLDINMMYMANDLAKAGLLDEAEVQQRRILEICGRLLGVEHQRTLEASSELALTLAQKGNPDEAEGMLRQCLQVQQRTLGEEHRDVLRSMNNLGAVLRLTGNLDEAEETLGRCLESQLRILGEKDSDVSATKNNLWHLHREREKKIGKEKAQRQEMEFWRGLLGEEHEETLSAMSTLAETLKNRGELDEAEELVRRCLDIQLRVLGGEDNETPVAVIKLADILEDQGKLEEAEAVLRDVIAKGVAVTFWTGKLASVLEKKGELDEAEAMLRRRVEIERDAALSDSEILRTMDELGSFLQGRDKLEEVEPILQECLRLREQIYGDENRSTLNAMNALASVLWKTGKLEEMEALNRRILEIRERTQGKEHPDTLRAMIDLAQVLREEGKVEEADVIERECHQIQSKAREKNGAATTAKWVNASQLLPTELTATGVGTLGAAAPAQGDGTLLVRDDFDSKLALAWKIFKPDPTHISLTKDPGTLTIRTQEGDFHQDVCSYENLFLIDHPRSSWEDFELTTCLRFFCPVADWNQAGLICHDDDDNYLKFVYEHYMRFGGPVLSVLTETAGLANGISFRPPSGIDRLWLRLAKKGTCYTFSASLNGKTFTPMSQPLQHSMVFHQGHVAWGDDIVKHVGIFAMNGGNLTTPEVDASFDFFEVRSVPGKTGEPEKKTPVQREGANAEDGR